MGGAVFPPCCLTWGQTMVGVMKIMETSFKKSHVLTATLSAPDPAAGHYRPTPPNRFLDTHRQVWISLLWGHAPVSWVLVHTRPSRTNSQKRCPFHYMGLECKSRKSRDTLSNRQIWPWSTKWNRAKVNSILPRECTGHSKHRLPTTQETTLHMDITRWSTPKSDCLYSLQPKMEKLYTVSKNKTESWLWLRSWTPYCQIQT